MYTESEIAYAKEVLRDSGYLVDGLWQVDDILMYAKQEEINISEEEAQEILDRIGRKWDASIGISWDTISYYLDLHLEERERDRKI